jgi:serine/threonine protein kinase
MKQSQLTKYKLSKNYSIESKIIDSKEYFFLNYNNVFIKQYQINETIYKFISYFNDFTTFDSVLNLISEIVSSSNKSAIYNVLNPFFCDLIKSKILVDEEDEKYLILEYTTKFKKDDIILNYKILEILNNNKNFDIYIAENILDKEKIVIKYLNQNKHGSQDKIIDLSRILHKEFNFMKKIDSDLVCKVYNLYQGKDFFFTMEYCNGVPVNQLIFNTEISYDNKISIIKNLISAISLVHQKGFYHGDIHFANVIISNEFTIKLIDFGMSGKIGAEEKKTGGVHLFIPPERINNSIGINNKKFSVVEKLSSEVYQIGILCYVILVADIPFKSLTINNLYLEKKNYNPENDFILLEKIQNTKIRDLLIKSLKLNPKDRFKDATEMFNKLNEILK